MSFVPEAAFPDPALVLKKGKRAVRNALAGKGGGLLCVLAVLFAASWAYTVDWRQVHTSLITSGPVYDYDPAVLAEAKALGLDYDAVSTNPAAHAGKPVFWCLVKQTGMDRPFVDGNMSWVVSMDGGQIVPAATGRRAPCKFTLARIERTAAPGVHLAFLAHP